MLKAFYKYLLTGLIAFAMVASANAEDIKIARQVIGAGGMLNVKNSDGVQLSGIFGQVAIGKISASSAVINGRMLDVYQGFWVPLDGVTSVEDNDPGVNFETALRNYPNPFNVSTMVEYNLETTSYVTLKIYDLNGNLVKVLADGIQSSGRQSLPFDGLNENGVALGSGSYFYELQVRPAQLVGDSGSKPYSLRNVMIIVK